MSNLPEPWMRGPIPGVNPLVAPVLFTFRHATEDLEHHTEGLTVEQLWAKPFGFGSVGFHILHIAGSTDRLMAYLQDRQLTAEELAAMEAESSSTALTRDELFASLKRSFAAAEVIVRTIDPATLPDPRGVGRQKLPTTVIGLLVHASEHTQRHVGQAISAAKLARQSVPAQPPGGAVR